MVRLRQIRQDSENLCARLESMYKYGNHAYSGIVEGAEEYDIYIECMHHVRRKNTNYFLAGKN